MTSQTEPLTVDQHGKAPVNRITDAAQAWGSYQQAREVSIQDDARFASMRGIYDRFPPINPADLERQGMADMPNINMGQFTAKVNTYVSTWLAHNTGGDKWFEAKLKAKYFNSEQEAVEASDRVSRHFNDAIKQWDGVGELNASHYIFESAIRDTQMGIFGLGIAQFPDAIDWRFRSIPTRKVYVPKGTKIMMQNGSAMWLEISYSVSELYAFRDKKGWNKKELFQLLYDKTAQNNGTAKESYSEWENRVRDNDAFLRFSYFNLVDLVEMFCKEFDTDGKKAGISRYVMSQYGNNTKAFIYEMDREYDRWQNVFIAFADSTGPEGDWHGIRGFGDSIYDQCHFNNLFYNHVALTALVSSLPLFECSSETDREKLNQIVFSRLGVLFPGLQLSQQRIQGDVTGCLAVLAENNRVMNQNTRIFPQNDARAGGEQPTATEVTYDRQDQATFTTLQVQFYRMTGADRLGFEMFRRMSQSGSKYPKSWPGGETAAWFREQCKMYGVTEEALRDPEYVRVTRTGMSGNPALDSLRADQALQVATPGIGQMNARKEKIAALYGRERVPDFIQDGEQPMPEDVLIGLENAILSNGQIISAYPQQDHLRHLGEPNAEGKGHIGVIVAVLQALQQLVQGGVEQHLDDAIKAHKTLESAVAHMAIHVNWMAQMPMYQETVKPLSQMLNQFTQLAEGTGNVIQKAAQARQPDNGMSPEAIKAMSDAQIQMKKMEMLTEHEIRMDEAKQGVKMKNTIETQESRRATKEATAALDAGLKAESTLAEIEMQKAKDASKLRNDAITAQAKAEMEKAKPKKPTKPKK